jgi:hypothetical protein
VGLVLFHAEFGSQRFPISAPNSVVVGTVPNECEGLFPIKTFLLHSSGLSVWGIAFKASPYKDHWYLKNGNSFAGRLITGSAGGLGRSAGRCARSLLLFHFRSGNRKLTGLWVLEKCGHLANVREFGGYQVLN